MLPAGWGRGRTHLLEALQLRLELLADLLDFLLHSSERTSIACVHLVLGLLLLCYGSVERVLEVDERA